jgi:hypothetical protein
VSAGQVKIEQMFEDDEAPDVGPSCNDAAILAVHPDGLSWILEQPPSSVTVQALEVIRTRSLSARDRVLLAIAMERQLNWCQAIYHETISQAATRCESTPVAADPVIELGLGLGRSWRSAEALVAFADRLLNTLPVMHQMATRGVSMRFAKVLDEETALLTDEQAARVDAEVSPRAASLTLQGFTRQVRRAVAKIDPDIDAKRHQKAKREQSGVQFIPAADGMAIVGIKMPAADAVRGVAELNARADKMKTEGDERSHGQRVVDGFFDALASPVVGDGKVRFRRTGKVNATIDLLSLLGLRNEPGEIAGYGPVSAAQIRDMLRDEDTMIHRLVYDPVTGKVLDYQARGRYVDECMRTLISARDVTCRFPGCLTDAVYCDGEHCEEAGTPDGATSCANCGLMCRHHHDAKTFRAVDYTRPDPNSGDTEWETALGFRYRQAAATYHPDGIDTGDVEALGLKKKQVTIAGGDGGSGAPPPF